MKARICPHGNKDDLKDDIQKDSATAQYDSIRILIYIATFMPMRLGVVDIGGTYMRSGPITREIYVRRPKEWKNNQRYIVETPQTTI